MVQTKFQHHGNHLITIITVQIKFQHHGNHLITKIMVLPICIFCLLNVLN